MHGVHGTDLWRAQADDLVLLVLFDVGEGASPRSSELNTSWQPCNHCERLAPAVPRFSGLSGSDLRCRLTNIAVALFPL